ncbi:MAG TPA: PAS domain S-box protein, partial [Methanotrichaceae archaeon]|nr:PAS domain S-box protein [Methanotrichaceae archaeon]
MPGEINNNKAAPGLRQRAEEMVRKEARSASLSEVDVRALCHELEVHQIELELQNDELRRMQSDLAASEEKYRDLYEFAPVGYFTLDPSGKILESNLTGATLLGTERLRLANRRFQTYLASDMIPKFNAFCRSVMESDTKQAAEFQLSGAGDYGRSRSFVLVEARSIQGGVRQGFRMTVADIAERRRMEDELRKRSEELIVA